MTVRIDLIEEPELEFGGGLTGIEPRLAMKEAGAYMDFGGHEKVIELGLVCREEEAPAIKRWVESMGRLLLGEEANAERFREYPGSRKVFRCTFEIKHQFTKTISAKEYLLESAKKPSDRFAGLLDLYSRKIESLFGDVRPDVVLVGLAEEEANFRIANAGLSPRDREILEFWKQQDGRQNDLFAPDPDELKRLEELKPQADELLFRSFYRALKAKLMQHRNAVPLQILREHTYLEEKATQSAATRAWNLGVSLFYKAGNIPWRPKDLPSNFCFVGISFHHLKRQSGDLIYASVAQAFSSTVQPFVLKGAVVPHSQTRNRQPYLTEDQARDLILRVIEAYETYAGVRPDRLILHKTSRYQEEETRGFNSASKEVPAIDLIWLSQTGLRLVKKGENEVWRGTLLDVDGKEHYLFTTGFVPWWKEYPGPHIPSPILFGSMNSTDLKARAKEILALTKMNWNSSDGLSRFPVTISFARRVGMVMTELSEEVEPNPSYRFYM